MADPLCRWRNSTPKNVCELVSQLPKTMLSSSDFRLMMKDSIYGDGFFTTPYQLACQLGLYVENEGTYIPRFKRDITEEEASAYLYYWFKRYYVPNPYTKRGFQNMSQPVIVFDAFVDYLKEHNNTANFNDISRAVFGEPINNVDILVNCFNNYSRVITIDKSLQAKLLPNYEEIIKERDMDRIDKSAFFQQFEIKQEENSLKFHIDEPLQLIYYGAPGTGKSFTIDEATDENNSVRTTFHPDSDYAGFVGAYKPTMKPKPINAIVGTTVHHATSADDKKAYEDRIVYKYVPQAFLKAYVEAWKRYSEVEDNPYYLVIEEINRGNCAQIFGDLFQLLDRNNIGSSSYAISADEDIAQFLRDDENGFAGFSEEQKDVIRRFVLKKDSGAQEQIGQSILDGSKLLLPPNMRIWATMNTSDQSLFPIDSAFKRRWNWEYMPIEYEKKYWTFVVGGKRYLWGDFLKMINPKIFKLTMSEDKQMGYFFAKPDKKSNHSLVDNDMISEKVFVNKVLFYLWTDVFKDYDLTEEPFVYEENNVKKAYRFTDFFPVEGNRMLAQFVEGLKLPLADALQENQQVEFDAEGDTELNNDTNSKSRDYSKYSVNGNGSYTKSDAVVEAVKAMIETMPEATAADVLEKIKSLNLSYTLAYSDADYQYYLERSNDTRFAKRYAKIDLTDGQSVYIYRGSTPERIGELIAGLNNSESGVVLAKIE